MVLVGSQSGIGATYFDNLLKHLNSEELKELPFVPSPYCNPDIKEHRRVEVCKDLIGDAKYRAVGICKRCGTKKFYLKEKDVMNNQIVVQGQSNLRRY
jgi:hypothetical protein